MFLKIYPLCNSKSKIEEKLITNDDILIPTMYYHVYRMPFHYNTHLHAKCSENFKIDSTSVTDVTANIRQKNVLKQLITIRIRSEKKGYFMNEFCRPIREDNTMCSGYRD